jgi:hypothetical protein
VKFFVVSSLFTPRSTDDLSQAPTPKRLKSENAADVKPEPALNSNSNNNNNNNTSNNNISEAKFIDMDEFWT